MNSNDSGSDVIGRQRPRILSVPPSLSSVGKEVVDLAELAGLTLDPWQAWVMDQAMAQRPDRVFNEITGLWERKWAAFEVGLVVSRQNGKGSILEARELAGLFLLGERLIIHSAHQFDTSKEAFGRILTLIEQTPEFDKEIFRVSRSHGEEGIELKNGQRLRFRTRTKGGGRGFTCDCLILDEAMILNSAQVGAIMPTLSARPNPQLWYTGSAGDKESTQLGRTRQRAINGIVQEDGRVIADPRLFYAEWSIDSCTDFCPPDCDEHDPHDSVESYAKANPGLGIRITVEHIESERRSMDPETFAMERLGVGDWPVEGDEWRVIPKDVWESRINELSEITSSVVLGVDTTPDRAFSCIAAAGTNEDDMYHMEVTTSSDGTKFDHRPGTQWVVPRIMQMINGSTRPVAIVIDKGSQASGFIDDLTTRIEDPGVKHKAKILSPMTREYAEACGAMYSSFIPRKGNDPDIVHIDQVPLNNAIAGADKRNLADMWAWDKRGSSVDISPLVACTLAVWGFKKMQHEAPPVAPWVYRR